MLNSYSYHMSPILISVRSTVSIQVQQPACVPSRYHLLQLQQGGQDRPRVLRPMDGGESHLYNMAVCVECYRCIVWVDDRFFGECPAHISGC